MEEDLDAAYQGYLQRQGVRAEAARQKRKRLGMEGELGSDEEEGAGAKKPEYEPGSDVEDTEQVSLGSCHMTLNTRPHVAARYWRYVAFAAVADASLWL